LASLIFGSLSYDIRTLFDTVDGRNPAPVDMVNIPLLAGFYTKWCRISSINGNVLKSYSCLFVGPFMKTYELYIRVYNSLRELCSVCLIKGLVWRGIMK